MGLIKPKENQRYKVTKVRTLRESRAINEGDIMQGTIELFTFAKGDHMQINNEDVRGPFTTSVIERTMQNGTSFTIQTKNSVYTLEEI